MNKNKLILLIALSCYQLYPNLEQPNPEKPTFEQPEFKDPLHLFSKRDLISRLKLEETAAQEFPDQSTLSAVMAFLRKHITGSKISHDDCTGRQVPEIGHDQKRKRIYSGEATKPTHIVLTFSGKRTLQDSVETLQKNRVAHNFIIDLDGSIYPVTAEGESIQDALKHRPFAVGASGKTIDGEYEERDMNAVSITISVVGHETQAATEEQEKALTQLVGWISNKFEIRPYNVVDYGTIALPYGRRNTQENLPWQKLAEQGLTIWPKNKNPKNIKSLFQLSIISAALRKIGYVTPITTNKDHPTFKAALITFQKHYKCDNTNGELTLETLDKLSSIIEQMENINPELKNIWPSVTNNASK